MFKIFLAELVKLPVDVVKFAEDAQTSTETDALLTATRAISLETDKPLITMGMGAAGQTLLVQLVTSMAHN